MYYLIMVLALLCVGGYLWKKKQAKARSAVAVSAPAVVAAQSTPAPGADKNFSGQVVIVTGGGTGLGRAMSLAFAQRGARVVIASRNEEHLKSVAAEITAAGGEAMTVALDVRNPQQVQDLVKQTLDRYGRIDVLVNNAAGNFLVPAEKLTPNGWNAVVGIVLNGTWYCSSFVGQQMIKQGGGCILNIVANYAWSGQPGVVHSAAAKAGVLSMTRTLAVEWGPLGIRVNALAPGAMVTQGASANLKFDNPQAQEKIRNRVPLKRLTSATEMAQLAVFLCSKEAAYINGDVMTADGGAWLPRGFLDLQD